MSEIRRALGPVRGRIRRNRAVHGAAAGFACGALAALACMVLSRLIPVPDKWIWACVLPAAGTAAGMAAGALRRVKNADAARAADRCGLQERAVTALENEAAEGAMAEAQRKDALDALKKLDVRQIRSGSVWKPLLAGAVLCAVCGALILIPGEQDRRAEALKALKTDIARAESKMDDALEQDEKNAEERDKSELRKIRDELKRDLERSRDEADALVALDKAEQRLEKMQSRTAGEAAEQMSAAEALAQALEAAGLDSLVQAAAAGDQSMLAQALAGMTAEQTAALSEAAESLSGDAQAASEAMEAAAQGGDAQQAAAEAMQALNASGNMRAGEAMMQALQGMKAMIGSAGNSSSQGQNGQGAPGTGGDGNNPGGGAGRGTTNEDMGGKGSQNKSSRPVTGSDAPEYREGKYETIYDPEKAEIGSRDEITNQHRLDDDSVQIEAGQGRGTLEGDVPYNRVIGEYAGAEARSADSENLTAEQREWVAEYFRLLTDE